MKTLTTVQKTLHVFQILSRIAFIFSIVGAVFCAVGALCSLAWFSGGQVFSLFGEPITYFTGREDASQVMAVLLSDLVFLTADAILLFFTNGYFKLEQAEGTPFTENGANLLKKLGIRCIYLPIVAEVIAAVILVCLGVERGGDISNLPTVGTGIALIVVSLIFRYGAELEAGSRERITDGNQ